MKTSCISHPANEVIVLIRKWQLAFCDGDFCAAALLSYFEYFHNWKIRADEHNKRANDIAEMHGDKRPYREDVFQYHTLDDFHKAILGLYSRNIIIKSLKKLEAKGAITTHKNPNPRYKFDNKIYYQFYPDICQLWLEENNYHIDKSDKFKTKRSNIKNKTRQSKSELTSFKNKLTPCKTELTITEITNKEIINQSKVVENNFDNYSHFEKPIAESNNVQTIIDSLIEKGIPRKKFYPDTIEAMERLHAAGATLQHYLQGLEIATRVTNGNGFGVGYLIKAVESILQKEKQAQVSTSYKNKWQPSPAAAKTSDKQPVYQNDLRNAMSWAGDVICIEQENNA